MTWLALDIGGANLKAADGLGYAATRTFELWKRPDRLSDELHSLIAAAPPFAELAITMTGELADCYATKAVGVRHILDAVRAASSGCQVSVYLTDGRLVTVEEAYERPLLAAASNWRALATFASRFAGATPALLLDMGSTTTDIIPLNETGPCPAGRTDSERLVSGELVYTGVERTPLSAVLPQLPWRGHACPVAAELFATTADAYVLLGELPEDADDSNTADGRPRTRAASHARMARMICADTTTFTRIDAEAAAREVKESQLAVLQGAALRVAAALPRPPRTLLLSGQGEFLLRELATRLPWETEVVSLGNALGPLVSQCAPAHALAVLARERFAHPDSE
jgi:hypothetical protein